MADAVQLAPTVRHLAIEVGCSNPALVFFSMAAFIITFFT